MTAHILLFAAWLPAAIIAPARPPGLPAGSSIEGTWEFVPAKSTQIATWKGRLPEIVIAAAGVRVSVIQNWLDRGQVAYADTFLFTPGGPAVRMPVRSVEWPENWFMGVLAAVGDERKVSGAWKEEGTDLLVTAVQPVLTSQGKTKVTTAREYVLGADGTSLTVTEQRSTRPTPVVLVFERKGAKP